MKVPKLSVAAIGFAILVIAMNLAVIRGALLGGGLDGWQGLRAGLLPHMLADSIFGPGPKGWAVFAFFLLPMSDALLIGAYRLRRRADHTAEAAGFVIAGSMATLAVFTSCLISPETAIGMVKPISRRIALASLQGLTRLFGGATPQTHALEWTYAVILAVIVPIAFFCLLPLLVAVLGKRVARNLGRSQPARKIKGDGKSKGIENQRGHNGQTVMGT